MAKYRAISEWSDGWWAVHVEGERGVWTQARRLDKVPAMAADALSMMLDRRVDPDEVEVVVRQPRRGAAERGLAGRGRARHGKAGTT